jgi:hypothetical protein
VLRFRRAAAKQYFNNFEVKKLQHFNTAAPKQVSIPQQSWGLYDCWPLKGA